METHTRGHFQGDEGCGKLSQSAQTIGKIALNLKTTLARPLVYDRAYLEKFSTASPGNPVGVSKPSLLSLIVQQGKKFFEESASLMKTQFLTIFGNKSMQKVHSESKLVSKPSVIHIA